MDCRVKPGNDRKMPMNLFDAAIYLCLIVAIVAGFRVSRSVTSSGSGASRSRSSPES